MRLFIVFSLFLMLFGCSYLSEKTENNVETFEINNGQLMLYDKNWNSEFMDISDTIECGSDYEYIDADMTIC